MWRSSLGFFFFFVFHAFGSSICESAAAPLWPPCYRACVMRANPAERLRELLGSKFFGQSHVIQPIIEMFEMRESTDHLISFHIAGDNGVGKSYITQLFSEALFVNPTKGGLLILYGTNFVGSNASLVEQHKASLFNIITEQLRRCPTSLIVLDEAEYVHSDTLRVLHQFMDEIPYVVTPTGMKVFKQHAMLGIVTDFGKEGLTEGMNTEELEKVVEEHAIELWGGDPRQYQLLRYTFPFVPLSNEDLKGIIRYELSQLSKKPRFQRMCHIEITPEAADHICNEMRRRHPHENGRGVQKWLNRYLIPTLSKKLPATGTMALQIKMEGSELAVITVPCVHLKRKEL